MSLILMLQIRYLNAVRLANDCSFWFAWLWTSLYKQTEDAVLWFTGSETDVIRNLCLGKYLDIIREEPSAHFLLVTQAISHLRPYRTACVQFCLLPSCLVVAV